MSVPISRLMVLAGEKFACIRITGKGDFTNSVEFTTLVRELRQKGYGFFVLDLSECALLDSTFLGALAGFGLKLSETEQEHCDQGIELLNPNAGIVESLETIGVSHLFKVTHGSFTPAEPLAHTPIKPSKEETTRACLEAHRTLMEINPANVARFKDVAQFLAEDLKKLTRKD
jgi:anti-anti-sigma regulatory factor